MKRIKIKDLNQHIIDSIKTYPLIFKNRWYVLEHLFCTIGNGYDWSNDGYLVTYKYDDRPLNYWEKLTLEEYILKNNTNSNFTLLKDFYKNFYKNEYTKQKMIAANAEKLSKIFKPYRNHGILSKIYPLSKNYSMILNFPDNVQSIYHSDMGSMMVYILTNYDEYKSIVKDAMDRLISLEK